MTDDHPPGREPAFPGALVAGLAVLAVAVLVALVGVSRALLRPLAGLLVSGSGGDVTVQVAVSSAVVAVGTVLGVLVTHRAGGTARPAPGPRRVSPRAVTGAVLALVYVVVTWTGLPAVRSTHRGQRRAEVVDAFLEAGGTASAGSAHMGVCTAMALGALVLVATLALWGHHLRSVPATARVSTVVLGFWLVAGTVLAVRC